MNIPLDLKNALESGSCVLFVGAGMGYNMIDTQSNNIPDGTELANRVASKFSLPKSDNYNLIDVATFLETKKNGRRDLIHFIREILRDASPDEFMMWIPTIKWKAIYTTNYDQAIQKAYDACEKPAQNYITVTHISDHDDYDSSRIVPIVHLHGSLFHGPDVNNIVISQQDYIDFAKRRRMLFNLLQHSFVKNCILFTGYSHNDTNFQKVLSELLEEIAPDPIRKSYRIDPYTDQLNAAILKSKNIETLDCKFSEFVSSAKVEIETHHSAEITVHEAKDIIPSDFWEPLENDIVPITRLFNSWEYINQVHLTGNSDISNFIRGDKASWDIIMQGLYFKRTIEEELEYQMLEYAISDKKHVKVCTVTGSAGYGISTLLKVIASRIIKEQMGQVFFLRDGKKLNSGDIFYAHEIRKENAKLYFFIDNAADYGNEINSLIRLAREQKRDFVLVLGDRQNELASVNMLGRGDVYQIEALNDSEIESIIDYLQRNNQLNKLEYLSPEDKTAAIKKNYNRELLVTIREATEGKSFDAIIQDEYYGIGDALSQQAYKVVACLHQFDVQVRMDFLATVLDENLIEFYKTTENPLKGVVVYDLYNIENDIYVARTRQRLIAQIVWDNCVPKAEKDTILTSVLDNINISHYLDRKAFEHLYQSDRLVDSLPSLESRLRFFTAACRVDPNSPYVRQHYARMLVRHKQDELALSTIEQAISMDDSIRMLHHTKGYILHHIAMRAPTIEIARKRIVQSEEAYRKTINMNERDPYGYQGLGRLFIDWAKKIDDVEEETLYLSKAEDLLTSALNKVYDKDAIWIELSKIDEYLDDTPGQIQKLQHAVTLAPDSPFANFLLAKTYLLQGNYKDAISILKPIFQMRPQEYRNSIEYARAVIIQGNGDTESIRQAIAILQQSVLEGYSDARFVCILGGLLYLDKQFSESENVFLEARRREIQYVFNPLFIPSEWGINAVHRGTVKYVGGGYSRIAVDDYNSEIRCPYSKIHGQIMALDLKINVEIKFNVRGPLAYYIP